MLPLPVGTSVRVVLAEGGERPVVVSAIARSADGRTAWQWTPEALARGEAFSHALGVSIVRQVPFTPGVHVVGKREMAGLPGCLYDSVPDAWGRLVTDRALRALGVSVESVSGIDRLAVVGDRGAGALVYVPQFSLGDDTGEILDLDRISSEAQLALEGHSAELLVELAQLGGSAGGSRPKAWIAVDAGGRIRSGAGTLRPDETGWLVKFRARTADPEDVGPLEYAYARMAIEAGIEVAEPWLIETSAGSYFASRRFDRAETGRVHVLSVAGLLNVAPDRAVAQDYKDLLRLTRHLTRSETEVAAAYRNAVFNVLAHNRDDHLRQFAFMRRGGAWVRTPAYDLTFSNGPGGEHTLLVAGEGRSPQHAHLAELAKDAGIKPLVARAIVDQVRGALARWDDFASDAGVSTTSRKLVASKIKA